MLVKGIIEEVINIHQARVRMPRIHKVAEDPSGTKFDDLPIAIINTPPGVSPFYAAGDVVIIGFENDDTSAPIVLGLLYKKDNKGSTSGITTPDLKVETNVNLPNTIHVGEDPNNVFSLTNEYGQTTENRLNNIEDSIGNIDLSPYAKKALSFSCSLSSGSWSPVVSDSWLVFGDSSNFGYLVYDISQDLNLGTGNFTFSVSFNATAFPNSGYTFAFAGSAGEMFIGWYGNGSTVTGFGLGRVGQAWDTQITGLSLTGWHTYKVTKSSGQVTLYIDGTSVKSEANTQSYIINATNGKIYVGNDYTTNYPIKGNMKGLSLNVGASILFALSGGATTSSGTYGSAASSINTVDIGHNIGNYTQAVAVRGLGPTSNVILSPNPSSWNLARNNNVYAKTQQDFTETVNIGSLGSNGPFSFPDRGLYTSVYVNTGSAVNSTKITFYENATGETIGTKTLSYHSTTYLGELLGILYINEYGEVINLDKLEKLKNKQIKIDLQYGSTTVTNRRFYFRYPLGKLTFSTDTVPASNVIFNGLIVY